MLKKLAFLAILVVLIGAAAASAAWLPVNGGTIAAGADSTLSCDTDGVEVIAYGLNTLAGPYEGVEYVTIGDVNSACAGAKIFARVTLADGKNLYSSGTASGYTDVVVGTTPLDGNLGYRLYLQDGQPGPLAYPLAEDIVELKVWLEGASN